MADAPLTEDQARLFRSRVEYEGQLLNDRTTIVLELNGLAALAVSFGLAPVAKSILIALIVVIDALWIVCAIDAGWLVRQLTDRLADSAATPIDEQFRLRVQKGRIRIGSTKFMSLVVPSLLLLGWIIGVTIVVLDTPMEVVVPGRAWFTVIGVLAAFLGAAALAWGLVISKQQAIELGSPWLASDDEGEAVRVPPVQDRLRQSRNAKIGLLLILLGTSLQLVGAWPG
jgi:hypothetical protein